MNTVDMALMMGAPLVEEGEDEEDDEVKHDGDAATTVDQQKSRLIAMVKRTMSLSQLATALHAEIVRRAEEEEEKEEDKESNPAKKAEPSIQPWPSQEIPYPVAPFKSPCTRPIERYQMPSLEAFQRLVTADQPFVITEAIQHWPAMTKWTDLNYLLVSLRMSMVDKGKIHCG